MVPVSENMIMYLNKKPFTLDISFDQPRSQDLHIGARSPGNEGDHFILLWSKSTKIK